MIPPKVIGRYEIEQELARGGMGVVYLARDPLMKRQVAIKLLKGSLTDDPDVRDRFKKEAEAVAALEHPAIVPIYDFGEHHDQLYFVMRYLAGGTLAELIGDGALSLRELLPVLERMAEALDGAHATGLVHRDVKPANILFDKEANAYLSDFGVAKVNEPGVDATGTLLIGTPRYMSPEQAQGLPVDARSDVYSLGVVAYHALAGEPPFMGNTPMALAFAHVTKPVPPISERVELPKVSNDIFSRVMSKTPEERYESAGDFIRDMRDLAAGRWYLIKLDKAPDRDKRRRTAGDEGRKAAAKARLDALDALDDVTLNSGQNRSEDESVVDKTNIDPTLDDTAIFDDVFPNTGNE